MYDAGETGTWSYAAIAESVPRARAALTEFARESGISGVALEAIRLAASEAITNVVMHAYADGGGTIHVSASRVQHDLWILVADDGGGLHSDQRQSTGLGLGLVLIAQLASDFEIVSRGGGGTELRMRFQIADWPEPEAQLRRGSFSTAVSPA